MERRNEVTIYTKQDCPYCDAAKLLLDWNEIEYSEIYVDNMSKRNINGRILFKDEQLPKIFINDKLLGGYQQLVDFVAKEKF